VDPKEDLHKAAIREVFEETGIKTEFVGILSARQSHVARFGKSDLYVTCLLKPLTNQITIQEEEIEAAKWMPLDALFELEYYKGTHLYQKILEIGRDAHDGKVPIWEGTELPLRFAKGSNILYHGSKAKL
jgi:8-oxo-dGTP pyrophosphatase MutT (NUDIX family)